MAFSLLGSTFSRLTRLDPGPIAPAASLLTLGAGAWATFAEYVQVVPRAWARIGLALALGASMEIGGLATGFPFGRYAYTGVWWPSVRLPIGPFPLALPFAWLLMAGAARLAVQGSAVLERAESRSSAQAHTPPLPLPKGRGKVWFSGLEGAATVFFGGLLAAVVDLAMEPVMTGPLGYWRWLAPGPLPGGAPWANFLGWWGTATLAGLILTVGAPAVRGSNPRWVLGGFVVLILGLGLVNAP